MRVLNRLFCFFVVQSHSVFSTCPNRRKRALCFSSRTKTCVTSTRGQAFSSPRLPVPCFRLAGSRNASDRESTDESTLKPPQEIPFVNQRPSIFRSKNLQLWLDLRDTAIYPNEAFNLLHEQCFQKFGPNEHSTSLLEESLDGVLVSPQMFDKIDSHQRQSSLTEFVDCAILYVNDTTQELFGVSSLSSCQQSAVVGRRLTCDQQKNADLDLISSIETIANQQQWLIIELSRTSRSSNSESATQWMRHQTSRLIEEATATSNGLVDGDFEESSSGLFLPDLSKVAVRTLQGKRPPSPAGGVAIACRDRNAFMIMDAMLAELRNKETVGTLTTDSGICIPGVDADSGPSCSVSIALVLPLELDIWEAVLNVRSVESS